MTARVFAMLLMLIIFPTVASAIQLRWSTGASALSFQEARLCTLVVESDAPSQPLPHEWRLLWAVDGCPVRPQIVDLATAVQSAVAQVCAVAYPYMPIDVRNNETTTHFCSTDGHSANSAYVVLAFTPQGHGKFKAIAQADDGSTTTSAEATFNGGNTQSYQPLITDASYHREGDDLVVEASGIGFDSVSTVSLTSPNGTWSFPLDVRSRSATHLTAAGVTVALVPSCVLEAQAPTQLAASAIEAEQAPDAAGSVDDPGIMRDPVANVQPKDFAFVVAGTGFHIFYTRQESLLADDQQTKALGHQYSTDLRNWTSLSTDVLHVRDGSAAAGFQSGWDNLHIWAPSIVQVGLTYYMYYVGVNRPFGTLGLQKIGIATSTDLVNWTRFPTPLYTSALANQRSSLPWVASDTLTFSGAQFRDPYVMPDPDIPGAWMMFYTTIHKDDATNGIVGVARAFGKPTDQWNDVGPVYGTDRFSLGFGVTSFYKVESPHAVQRNGQWYLFATGSRVGFRANATRPYERAGTADSTLWQSPQSLYNMYNGTEPEVQFWQASEYLRVPTADPNVPRHEYLSAFTDRQPLPPQTPDPRIDIVEIQWTGGYPPFTIGNPSIAGVPSNREALALVLSKFRPQASELEFRIDVPESMPVRLMIIDVQGRRVRSLVNGLVSGGSTPAAWDGRDQNGYAVRNGVYFAQLLTPAGRRTLHLPMVR